MARMIAIYKTPKDIDAFDKHYFEVHIPLAKKLPGLIKYDVARSPISPTDIQIPIASALYTLIA